MLGKSHQKTKRTKMPHDVIFPPNLPYLTTLFSKTDLAQWTKLVYCARGLGFDPRTVQTFVCMNKFV
jgi:hypothetical protein